MGCKTNINTKNPKSDDYLSILQNPNFIQSLYGWLHSGFKKVIIPKGIEIKIVHDLKE